jgi:pimeloyl-ACP methyl ester carboxylesterase
MAAQVEAIRKRCPGTRICLMGHSSGTHVVLAAAESLPPGSIDRIVLLSPSVSSTYDLRRALKATCTGIDVYYSPDDGVLFVAIPNYGTADGLCGVPAAGQVGFCRPPASLPDSQLYGLVHQYRFDDNLYAGTGNHGGHHGPCRERFLRLVVLPNIMGQSLWANCPPRP